jgi:hypothetical protein
MAEASPSSWVLDLGLEAELAAEAEDAVPELLALLVRQELVAVALLEYAKHGGDFLAIWPYSGGSHGA